MHSQVPVGAASMPHGRSSGFRVILHPLAFPPESIRQWRSRADFVSGYGGGSAPDSHRLPCALSAEAGRARHAGKVVALRNWLCQWRRQNLIPAAAERGMLLPAGMKADSMALMRKSA